jgi:hypothetical protein
MVSVEYPGRVAKDVAQKDAVMDCDMPIALGVRTIGLWHRLRWVHGGRRALGFVFFNMSYKKKTVLVHSGLKHTPPHKQTPEQNETHPTGHTTSCNQLGEKITTSR